MDFDVHETSTEIKDGETIYMYADKLMNLDEYSSEYDDAGDLADTMIVVLSFDDTAFNERLFEFLKEKGTTPEQAIRGYMPTGKANHFMMFHGVGYAWVSSDLLGGSADGERGREFDRWLESRGDRWY